MYASSDRVIDATISHGGCDVPILVPIKNSNVRYSHVTLARLAFLGSVYGGPGSG